jgi:DNA-binding XRE family transcriptional regulator
MVLDKYNGILEQFRQYYPTLYDRAVDWWSSGRRFIIVRLADGSEFEFNPTDNSLRRLYTNECEEDEEFRRKAFGANLEKMIPLSGLSKGELAEKLGITPAMLTRYLKGTSMPSVVKAQQIASVIGCRIEDLFD